MKLVALLLLFPTQTPAKTQAPEPPQRKVIGTLPENTQEPGEPSPPDAIRDYVPDPATQLTIDLAEAQGSTLRELALAADDTMEPFELAAARKALERTGLFVIAPIDAAQATLQLRRLGPREVLATLTARAGERLWVKAVTWPKENTAKTKKDDEARVSKVQQYAREHLALRPIMQAPGGPTTIYYGGYQSAPGMADPSWGWGNGMIGGQQFGGQSHDWVVVRGTADIIDEVELAKLAGNRALEERIRDERFKPKLWWGLGFGLGAAAGISSGVLLYDHHHGEDARAIGFSLIGLGVGSAIMALLTPTVGNGNKLTVNETEEIIADYNHSLRQGLELSPADTQKLDSP